MPRGGARPGAGRKPKHPHLREITAAKVLTPQFAPPTTNPASPVEEFDAPDDLTAEERAVWLKQSPHAFRNRTLTRSTAMSFERYCKSVVWERKEAESSARGGANHRGLLKQINSYELQFGLTASGRPIYEPGAGVAQPENPLAKFRKA